MKTQEEYAREINEIVLHNVERYMKDICGTRKLK